MKKLYKNRKQAACLLFFCAVGGGVGIGGAFALNGVVNGSIGLLLGVMGPGGALISGCVSACCNSCFGFFQNNDTSAVESDVLVHSKSSSQFNNNAGYSTVPDAAS